jgi:hypothetical protein
MSSKPRELLCAGIVLAKSEGQESGGCFEIGKDEAGLAGMYRFRARKRYTKNLPQGEAESKHSQVSREGALWR